MKARTFASILAMLFTAIVARAETDPMVIKAQIKQTQAETKELRQQLKVIKQTQEGPLLIVKLRKAQAAKVKAQAALVKATAGVVK